MKIRRIRLENINSLRGEHEISFLDGPLASSRLFAITGPTGSGKSTILDVITLALYNQIPRLNAKITKNLILSTGAILTRNTQKALAEVEYECASGVFTSRWSIEYNRNDNLKDYEMEIAHLDGELIPLKKSEVPDHNARLIGLSYEQFVKSILLAQGAFAEFLRAKKSERGDLLEKITGTGIYRQLGIKAFERKKEFAEKLENLHHRKQEWEGQNPDDEKVDETRSKKKVLESEIQTLEKRLEEISRKQETQQNIEELTKKLKSSEASVKTSKAQLAQYDEEYGERIVQHRRTVGFSTELQELIQLEREQKRLGEELVLEENRHSERSEAKTALLGEIALLIGLEPTEKKVRDQLKEFEAKVKSIQEERLDLRRRYNFEKERLQERLPDIVPEDLSEPQIFHQKSKQNLKEANAQISALKVELNIESTDDLESIKERIENKSKAVYAAYGDYRNYLDRLKLKEKEEKQLKEIAERLEKLPIRLAKKKADDKELGHSVDKLELKIENHRLVAQLDEYRHKLIDGEACPLCGSKEHPFSAHEHPSGELKKLEEEFVGVKKQKSAIEREVLEVEQKIKTAESEKKRLKQQVEEHVSIIETSNAKLDDIYPKWKEIEDWEQLKIDFDKRLHAVKNLQKLTHDAENLQTAIQISEKMIDISKRGQKVSSGLKSIYTGRDIESDVDRLLSRWQSNEEALSAGSDRMEKTKKELAHLDIAHAKLSEKLDRAVKKSGFSNVQSAREARMSEEDYTQLKQGRDDLEKIAVDSQTKVATLQKTLEDLRSKFTTEESMDELKQKHLDVKTELTAYRARLQNMEAVLSLRKKCEEQIQRLNSEIQQEGKTARKWQLLHTMIGDAKGSKFNQFAQDLTLDQLLVLGNQRLKGLTDRYRMVRPNSEEDEALVILDNHMAGMRRSVRTLSGGETFLMSLSLALALSDMASRKIEINSLFVDEGFGTLDPETLDQTLDTLERLQAEGDKIIGIISHVDALKERISTQIELDRNSRGNSSMRVMG